MKKCILIFDDDSEILSVCKLILEHQNYQVETRASCNKVIEDIIKVKPDLILMDLWIPELGGENAIRLIKNNITTQHIPVIIFSANGEIEEIFKKLNANGFLRKPFDINHFSQIIADNVLEKKVKAGTVTASF